MAIEKHLIESLQALPPEKQQVILDFADFLMARSLPPRQNDDSLERFMHDLSQRPRGLSREVLDREINSEREAW